MFIGFLGCAGDRGDRRAAVQHRHFRHDGVCEWRIEVGYPTTGRLGTLHPAVVTLRPAPGRGDVAGQISCPHYSNVSSLSCGKHVGGEITCVLFHFNHGVTCLSLFCLILMFPDVVFAGELSCGVQGLSAGRA
jgi:hypothetical protein